MKALLLMPSRFFGGPEIQTLQAAKELKRRHGIDFVFAIFPAQNKLSGSNPMVLEARRAGFEAFEFVHLFNYDLVGASLKLRKLRKSIRPDVVCSIGYKANVLTSFMHDLPTLAVIHGWTASTLRLKLFEILDRETLRFHTAVGYVSPSQRERIKSLGVPDDRLVWLPNALDQKNFPPPFDRVKLRESLGRPARTRLVGAVGRLSSEKGQRFLVEAFAPLSRARDDLDLVLVGDGPEDAALKNQVHELKLDGRVHFLGLRRDGAQLVGALDVVALPSLTEAMPVVALEACAYRVPLVSSAVGAVPEILCHGKAGWLTEPGDVAALTRSIAEALDDNGRRASAAHDNMLAKYTLEAQAESWMKVLDICLKAKSGS